MSRLPALLLAPALLACAAARQSVPAVWPLGSHAAADGERDCDLVHVSLDLTLDHQGRRVYGNATSWIRALHDDTRRVVLHAVGLEIAEVNDSRGRALAFELDEPLLAITLAEPLQRGEEEAVQVTYAARPQRGMHFVDTSRFASSFAPQVWTKGAPSDNRHWLPTWDEPNDRATSDARLRVGLGMTALSNGELVETIDHGRGERTFHWRLEQRIPTYLIALAAGRWERYDDTAGAVPLTYWVSPGTGEERARAAFGETPAMLAFFEERLGLPFPYPAYHQVAVAEFVTAGMENAGLTLVGDHVVDDPAVLEDLDGDPRILVSHELAHQWFGDLVTCLGWGHVWLNEAWASYMELAWIEQCEGPAARALWFERYREWYLAADEPEAPVSPEGHHGEGPRSAHLYTKGPWVLRMIEDELGEEAFWRATRAYLARHADGFVTSADLVRAIFDETGRNVQGTVEQWVEAGGHPVFDVRLGGGAHRLELSVRQTQDFGRMAPLFELPVEVEVVQANGTSLVRTLYVRQREQTFLFPLDAPVVDVLFDAPAAVLCELRLDKPAAMWVRQGRRADRPGAQWRALGVLREFADEDPGAARVLLELLTSHPEPLLRQRAARLADFDDPLARRVLVQAVLGDPSARVRREAAHTLQQHAARRRFDSADPDQLRLLEHLGSEPSPAVRAMLERLLEITP
jgi:aminopeptidase N